MELIEVAGLLVFVIVGISPVFLHYWDIKRKIAPWRKFAASNNLTYAPRNFLLGGHTVTGIYRGYHLKLKAVRKGIDLHTHITLSVCKPAKDNLSHLGIKDTDTSSILENSVGILTATYTLLGQLKMELGGQAVHYEQPVIEDDEKRLQSISDLLSNIATAYRTVAALGGETVPDLQSVLANKDNKLRPIIIQLIQEIGQDTTTRLEHRVSHLLCPHCLLRFQRHNVENLSWSESIKYCGCRGCHQSQDFFEGKVVATLNDKLATTQYQKNGLLWVNWLAYRSLFDFDAVHIVRATDEDVERFAVQVGNDTDPKRKQIYKEIRCIVSPESELSENTMRVLRQMFGQVEVKDLAQS